MSVVTGFLWWWTRAGLANTTSTQLTLCTGHAVRHGGQWWFPARCMNLQQKANKQQIILHSWSSAQNLTISLTFTDILANTPTVKHPICYLATALSCVFGYYCRLTILRIWWCWIEEICHLVAKLSHEVGLRLCRCPLREQECSGGWGDTRRNKRLFRMANNPLGKTC